MSAWTDRLQYCMATPSAYLALGAGASGRVQYGPRLAGGLIGPNGFPAAQIGIRQGMIAAYDLVHAATGSGTGASKWATLESIVPWAWTFAAEGHSEPNAMLEKRRQTAQVLRRSLNRWEFMFRGGRPAQYTTWNSDVNLGSGDPDAFPYFAGYQETLGTNNSSAYRPWGNKGFEAWAQPSGSNPEVLGFRGAINKTQMQDSDGYCTAFQVRVIPVNPALPIDRSRVKFIAQMGFDLYGDTPGAFPWFSGFQLRNAQEGSNGRWIEIPSDGQWYWVVCVVSGDLVPSNNVWRPPFASAAGVADYAPGWPYSGPSYGGRSWAQIIGVDAPIDLMTYYGEGGGGENPPPPDPPPVIPDTEVLPGLPVRPYWQTQVNGGYKRWGPVNRPLAIAPTFLPTTVSVDVVAGGTLSVTAIASGSSAITYSKVAGPSWVSVASSTGVVSGTVPLGAGVYVITVRATNSAGNSGSTADLSITVNASVALAITTQTLPNGRVGTAYRQQLAAIGGNGGALAWGIDSGGSTLTATGLALIGDEILGDATTAGAVAITVRVTEAGGATDTQDLAFTIAADNTVPVLVTTELGPFALGEAQNVQLVGIGNGLEWSYTGTLPTGLALDAATGLLTGQATVAGSFTYTVSILDDNGLSASRSFTSIVGARPGFSSITMLSGKVGEAYLGRVPGTGDGTLTYSVLAGQLPSGLIIDPVDGDLIGTATQAGTFVFTAQIASSLFASVTQQFTITIAPATAVSTKQILRPSRTRR